jgi:hypothetical protein
MVETLDEDTLRGRRPVWEAMSDLFLDTEVRWQLHFVARACASSPYEPEQLDHIFWVEVFPLAIGNLLQVAGEWAMLVLDEQALIRRAFHGQRRPFQEWVVGSLVEREWKAVLLLIARLRAEPAERWPTLVQAWGVMLHRYFEKPGERLVVSEEPKVEALVAAKFPLATEWAWFESLARTVLLGDEAKQANERAAEVRAILRLHESS